MSEAAGSVLAGNPAAAGAGAGDTGAPPEAPTTPTAWGELPAELQSVVQTKGWQSPVDALTSYTNLEKLLGADKAGRALVPPKDDAPPEEWSQFWGKLGRPEAPEGYQLPLPEGDTGEFAKTAATWFHEVGLPAKQAVALTEKWNQYQVAQAEAAEAQYQQQTAVEMQNLQTAWGAQFDAQAELGRRAIRESGLTQEQAVAIERAIGVEAAAKAFAKLGAQYAEAPMKGGEGGARSSFGATPEDAKARIQALRNDQGWTTRYLNGDADARAEFERLHQIAFG